MILINMEIKENVILSPTKEYSILSVGEIINSHFGNEIVLNNNYSDGQYRKTADNSKLMSIINSNTSNTSNTFEFTDLKDGIEKTVNWFINNYDSLRK